jgi:hypothetical protein
MLVKKDIDMMRTIQISTDVFAAIWARRSDAEHSEDEILRVRPETSRWIAEFSEHEAD